MLINPPIWTQNGKYTAEQDRQLIGAIVRTEGVANTSDMIPTVITNSRQVSIGTGGAYVRGDYSASGGSGTYFCYNNGATEVTLPPAGSIDRYDLIILRIYDSAVSGSVNEARFQVISGTPASNPIIPGVPANSIPIAAVRVVANSSSLQTSNLSDQRVVAQSNGVIAGSASTGQLSRMSQLATPTNPVLATASSAPTKLLVSTGGGFLPVSTDTVVTAESDKPSKAAEGDRITVKQTGREYQMRDGIWKFKGGLGPFVSAGAVPLTGYNSTYLGGLLYNTGNSSAWGSEAPNSSTDYATYYSITKGTSGSSADRAGKINILRPGKFIVKYRYSVTATATSRVSVQGRISAPSVNYFSAVDNQDTTHYLQKGDDLVVSGESTVVVTSTSNKIHGYIIPRLDTSTTVRLNSFILRLEMLYEF